MSLLKKKTSVKKTEKEKIEERREEVLSQGRKFKYPLQYAKHKVVLWTVIIATLALAVMAGIGYLALYKFQNTGDMLYRLTKIIPAPVATIDGAKVRYSDYLMIYKSSIKPLEQQKQLGDDKDSETMRVHYKREALNEAENYTYALKLAEELGVKVSDKAVERAILRHRKAGGLDRSNESFEKVLHDNFGLTKSEYKRLIYLGLAKAEVAQKIDKKAEKIADEVQEKLKTEKDMEKVAKEMGKKVAYEQTGGMVDEMNIDGGRATVARKMKEGEVSKRILASGGDGYYFVKLLRKKDKNIEYESIKINLSEFNDKLKMLRKDNKVTERIVLAENKV